MSIELRDHPHAAPVAGLASALAVELREGLSSDEATRRLAADGPNELSAVERVGWLERVLEQFVDPLVVLLLVAIAISTLAWFLDGADGVPVDAVVILAIVLANAGIGLFQANRAENAVAALGRMSAIGARVLRDSEVRRVDARQVVVGDVVVFEEGDAVAADCRIVEANSLQIGEAPLTGESESVAKSVEAVSAGAAVADRSSMVFAGTAVVAGRGRGLVTGVGMQTQVGIIATLLSGTERTATPLEREIASVGRMLGVLVVAIAGVVVGAMLVLADIESAGDVIDVLLVGVSLAVAAVPEGLPAVLSVVLALGVQRMAGRNALVKRLASVETLGAATTICTDKTGTLTRGEMTVRAVVVGSTRLEMSGQGFEPIGALTLDGEPVRRSVADLAEVALETGARAANARVRRGPEGWEAMGNPTEVAVVVAAMKIGLDQATLDRIPRLGEVTFTSERKRMSVLVGADDGDEPILLVKGAPDVLLGRCTFELGPSGVSLLTDERRKWWNDQVDMLADDAMRTLAVARRRGVSLPITEEDEHDLEWLGVFGIIDPPREETFEAIRSAQASGIRVVMITGDHPRTAARIASTLGILEVGGRVVTGADLDLLDDATLAEVAVDTAVFARVAPAHKLRLVRALQAQGEVVAMTGDGVNDAPALKAADIGTAMGGTGTDVAREAAAMILTDDDFATIVVAVAEGRAIFHNVRSFLRYLLSSNVGEVLTVFFGILLAGVIGLDGAEILAPLTATQILWINLLTDTGPALALGVDPVDPRVMDVPPRRDGSRVVDRVMGSGIAVVGTTMAAVTLLMIDIQRPGGLVDGSAGVDKARTAGFTVLVLAQLFNCFSARSDTDSAFYAWARNEWLLISVGVAFGLQVLVVHVPFLNNAFTTAPLSLSDWLLSVVLASVVLWVSEIRKLLRRRRSSHNSPLASSSVGWRTSSTPR